jgi:hypothetical protein
MYRLTILSIWRNPLITPLVPKFLSLTWNHSFLCGAILVHPGPRLLVNWPPPSPFPPYSLFPPPMVPQSSYAPFYDNITTPTSLSSELYIVNLCICLHSDSNQFFSFCSVKHFVQFFSQLLIPKQSCLIIIRFLFDYCSNNVWLLFHYCSNIVWLLFDYCLIIVQLLFIILVLEMYSMYFDPVNT